MKGRIASVVLLAMAVALTIAFGARLRHEPGAGPLPSDRAIDRVIQTVNEEEGRHWRRTGGDAAGHIDLRDSYDYRKDTATPVDDPYLATMKVRPQDTDGFLYTADLSAGNRRTQRAIPFAKSRSGHVCIDFKNTGEALLRERLLATYHC